MVERKQDIKYLDNGNQVFYRSNKTWTFDQQRSCPTCFCSDKMYSPNLIYIVRVSIRLKTRSLRNSRKSVESTVQFQVKPICGSWDSMW
uniref:Uncharacterized protein n=1 Tax=Caenorhabditis tropicalis TaxID=1561998 RepID=A0A1I7USA6_9PELO